MQLMSDAVAVLGSRHGLFVDPCHGRAWAVRCGLHPGHPIELVAGLRVDGRTLTLPLSSAGERFQFCDQDMTPTSMKFTGIDGETRLKLEFTVRTPFRPRDGAFSTTPVLGMELRVSRLPSDFRWHAAAKRQWSGEVFLRIAGGDFRRAAGATEEIRWTFDAKRATTRDESTPPKTPIRQADALVIHSGQAREDEIVLPFDTGGGLKDGTIRASWCTFSGPALDVEGRPAPFKYTERFESLDDVVAWARANPDALADNSRRVDGIFAAANCSAARHHLLAQTLHSWLVNTWWTLADGRDLFTVWEGFCYYHSTVDVEYTQTPLYLAVWPELLGYELDAWPRFVTDGSAVLGEAGQELVMFTHDIGRITDCSGTMYNHAMPVEENTNYVLMSYAYWRRIGDFSRVERHAEIIEKALRFVAACDTTGNGVPDTGMANTIDDASPAVQFGREQVYLAVKAMAALDVGAEMLAAAGRDMHCDAFREQAGRISRVIHETGWAGDHFVTLLDASPHGVTDPWTGKTFEGDGIPGWDAAHIYTANGLALLDMVGRTVDIDESRLRTDLAVATQRCMEKFGCRHSSYVHAANESTIGEGGTSSPPRVGWISMNMLRDISAFYRGLDLRNLAAGYWDFQTLTNTQGPWLFFETFGGNNLMQYPRGVAIFGCFDALGGVRLDRAAGRLTVSPMNDQVRVPLLALADWQTGRVPMIRDARLHDRAGLVAAAGLSAKDARS